MNTPPSPLWSDPLTAGSPARAWWKRNWWWGVPVAVVVVYALSMAIGPLLLLAPVVYLGYRLAVNRTNDMQKVCTAIGFTFEQGPIRNLSARFGEIPRLVASANEYNHGQNLMTGSVQGHSVTVTDHVYGAFGRKRSDTRETLAVFPEGAKGLPDFALSPGGSRMLRKIAGAFGVQNIPFAENAEFAKHYDVHGADETAIRRAFGPTTLAYFAAHRGWSVDVHRGAMAVYRFGRLCRPAEVQGFLAEATAVLGAFDVSRA